MWIDFCYVERPQGIQSGYLLSPLFQELKRRNVFRVAIAYLAVTWLLLQAAAQGDANSAANYLNKNVGLVSTYS